jgi:hypothetical protein
MTVIDLPTPILITRHQCPFCRRYTRADQTRVEWHMIRCLKNPGARNCGTCEHHQEQERGVNCIPGRECVCNDWDEACTHPDGPEDSYRFPVQGCPLWQAKETP